MLGGKGTLGQGAAWEVGSQWGCSSSLHRLPLPGLLIEHSACAGCWGHKGTDTHSPCPSSTHQSYRESGTCKGKSGTVFCPVVGCRRSRRLGGLGWVLTHKPGQEGASGEMGRKPVGRGRTLGGLSPQRSRKASSPSLWHLLAASGSLKSLESQLRATYFRETPAWLGLGEKADAPSGPLRHTGAEHPPIEHSCTF